MGKIKSGVLKWVMLASVMFLAAGEFKLVKTKVNEKITVSIPKGWRPMDGMDFTQRYPSVRAPLAAYTDVERLVDFSVNISATQWPDRDLTVAKQFFKASLINMFDRVDMIEEGVHKVGNKEMIFFEFDSRVNGNKKQEGQTDPVLKYTYIQYLIEPGQTTVFSFNCPKRMKEDWQDTARQMMKSIKVK